MSILIPVSELGINYHTIPNKKSFFVKLGKGKAVSLDALNKAVAELVEDADIKRVILYTDFAIDAGMSHDDLLTLVDVMSCQAPVFVFSNLRESAPLNKFLMKDTALDWIRCKDVFLERGWKVLTDAKGDVVDVFDCFIDKTNEYSKKVMLDYVHL